MSAYGDNELDDFKARQGLTEEQLKNLGTNLVEAQRRIHFMFEVEAMKDLEPKDKQEIVLVLAKTLTDEQVRETILQLQKMLCNR